MTAYKTGEVHRTDPTHPTTLHTYCKNSVHVICLGHVVKVGAPTARRILDRAHKPSDCQKLNIATSDLDMLGHVLNYTDLHFKQKVFTANYWPMQRLLSYSFFYPWRARCSFLLQKPNFDLKQLYLSLKKANQLQGACAPADVFFHNCRVRLANDAYEKNCGMIFEYGHTVSHAIEKVGGHDLKV